MADERPAAPAGDLGPLCALEDDVRRRLYEHVAGARRPVSRDEAAAAAGVDRALAAYHLDKLVGAGLLVASFARPPGRGGPGAGRPAKHYEPAAGEYAASVPPRDYRLAAEVLARAVEADASGGLQRHVEKAARAIGRELATGGDDLIAVLHAHGFRPYEEEGTVRLGNCPFHRLAGAHTEVVCGLNLAMLSGLVAALPGDVEPRLDPAPGRCCVALRGAAR